MAIRYKDHIAILDDHCAVEEAESFLDWMRQQQEPMVDLGGCSHLHAAILQILLALRPTILVPPEDAFLRRLPLDWAPPAAATEPAGEAEAAAEPPALGPEIATGQDRIAADAAEQAAPDRAEGEAEAAASAAAGDGSEARPRPSLQEPLPVQLGPADRRPGEEQAHG
ncbi:hypothetical protein [Roseomonas sp. USHLN139]|uniref:hypothetical protein n=1 Tax=Roseomonas sp. USHLN139 TaxID=3081298 RepID=UPI003B011485